MRIRVLYHDHCFDGAASAAFFTRFAATTLHPGAEFDYTGMMHKPAQTWDEGVFDGDVNAIVDFKYAASEKLTWWFDHHQSAFLTPEDAEHFRQSRSPHKFYDPTYKSCTLFISTIARERFGFAAADLDELVHWADIIDGAQYPSARDAVELSSPATQLVLVIEGAKGSDIVQKIIRMMGSQKLAGIMENAEVRAMYEPLYRRHVESIDIIRESSRADGKVVFFDLAGTGIEGYNKFIPYYLFPDAVYTISVLTASFRTKVSVGSNPWAPEEPRHNLATICERYGGGGHARVGAISFEPGALDQARQAATEIAGELSR
jgi:hypothetical protein